MFNSVSREESKSANIKIGLAVEISAGDGQATMSTDSHFTGGLFIGG
jgi:hypothetical protein